MFTPCGSGYRLESGCSGTLLAINALVIGPGRRWRYLAVGWFWYLGTLVPVIGLVQVGAQAMADRYTYVPLIGIFLMATWGVGDLIAAFQTDKAVTTGTAAVTAATVLCVCAVLAWIQVGYWATELTLWQHPLDVMEDNSLAHELRRRTTAMA